MTEISDTKGQTPIDLFVLQWGDMGSQWGVNRSVAQIHAVLYLSDRTLTADEIATKLGIARSNVSNSLKDLLGWNLIRRVPVKSDRREHFEAETDPWEMFMKIAAGRKKREIDPAIAALQTCVVEAEHAPDVSAKARARLTALLEFVEMMDGFYGQMLAVPKSRLAMLVRLGSKIFSFLPERRTK